MADRTFSYPNLVHCFAVKAFPHIVGFGNAMVNLRWIHFPPTNFAKNTYKKSNKCIARNEKDNHGRKVSFIIDQAAGRCRWAEPFWALSIATPARNEGRIQPCACCGQEDV